MLLFSCVLFLATPNTGARGDSLDRSSSLLADGYDQRFAQRVRVRSWKGGHLEKDGRSPVRSRRISGEWNSELVVVEPGDKPRVVVETSLARVLLYFDPSSLHDVVQRQETLTALPDPAHDVRSSSGFALLAPGLSVNKLETRGDRVRVTTGNEDVEISGWISRDALGKSYTPKRLQRADASEKDTARVLDGTGLFDINGNSFGRFRPVSDPRWSGFMYPARKIARPQADRIVVEYFSPDLLVQAFLPRESVRDYLAAGQVAMKPMLCGAKSGHGMVNPNRVTIQAGTSLYSPSSQKVVAVTTRASDFFASKRIIPPGWLALTLHADWGDVVLWWNVSEEAFAKGTFGEMIQAKRFYWMKKRDGHPFCEKWEIHPDPENPFQGGISRVVRSETSTHSWGWSYDYSIGNLRLLGPGGTTTSSIHRGTGSSWGRGEFHDRSITATQKNYLLVGNNRWYFRRAHCLRDRAAFGRDAKP